MKNIFDVREIENYLVILNSSNTLLIIINPLGDIVLSKNNITVMQVRSNYISVKENNFVGVYKYDGSIVVPFEYKFIFIKENEFLVSKSNKYELVPYNKE